MSRSDDNGSLGGSLVSVAFWLCLFLAAAMYACAAVAPRADEWSGLRRQSLEVRYQLVELQRTNRHLEKLCDELEHNPDFVAELARYDMDATRAGDGRLSVDPSLGFDPRVPVAGPEPPAELFADPWYIPWLRRLADDTTLRRRWLGTITGLVFVAFTMLHEGFWSRSSRGMMALGAGLNWLTARYRREA
ncbi:hypothetical protein Mal4_26940 [Maioricimonas rarisocia]|uniref:Septum formation initiator n=1 Tax=Maioricimonas rarisocia TaxID=2528026 RepID=A0A517Z7B2_9PLAN|nr:hypothetical protein [Maioricimonas rarisocia]QDU38367.1 hypothetical protein Mal4_26940 [Maioricimonas rarisocia]